MTHNGYKEDEVNQPEVKFFSLELKLTMSILHITQLSLQDP